MRNFLNGLLGYSGFANPGAIGVDEDSPKIKASKGTLKAEEARVAQARFIYQMALASGDHERIWMAENQLRKALINNIYLKGGRMEDILMMTKNLTNGHSLGDLNPANSSKLVVTIGLLGIVLFLIRCGV